MSQNQILQRKYNEFQQTINDMSEKINELATDAEEHTIVLKTLQNTPEERRCFRMVGGALVEKNVKETIPVLELKLTNIKSTIEGLTAELKKTTESFEEWKKEKKIKIIRQ